MRINKLPFSSAFGAALGVSLICGSNGWGHGVDSVFTFGLWTQPWGVLFHVLALGSAYRFIREGRGLFPAVAYTLLCGFSHPFLAIALAPSLLVLPWWSANRLQSIRRILGLGVVALILSSFFWVPILAHYDHFGGFPYRSPDERGISLGQFLKALAFGQMLDYNRVPLLALLMAAGFLPAFLRAIRGSTAIASICLAYFLLITLGPFLGKITSDDLIPAVRFLALFQVAAGAMAGMVLVNLALSARERPPGTRRVLLAIYAMTAIALAGTTWYSHSKRIQTASEFKEVLHGELMAHIDQLKSLPPGRITSGSRFGTGSHWAMHLPYAYAGKPAVYAPGAGPLQSSANFRYVHRNEWHLLGPLGASYILGRKDRVPGRYKVLFETENLALFATPYSAFYGVRLVGTLPNESRAERLKATDAWMKTSDPRRKRLKLIGNPAYEKQRFAAEIRILNTSFPSPSKATVRYHAKSLGYLAFSTTYHPGWRAESNGKAVPILRAGPDIMVVEVPEGEAEISFEFRRPTFTWGLLAACMLGLGFLWLFAKVFEKRLPRTTGA